MARSERIARHIPSILNRVELQFVQAASASVGSEVVKGSSISLEQAGQRRDGPGQPSAHDCSRRIEEEALMPRASQNPIKYDRPSSAHQADEQTISQEPQAGSTLLFFSVGAVRNRMEGQRRPRRAIRIVETRRRIIALPHVQIGK